MKNFVLTFGVVFTLFKERLSSLGYVHVEEKKNILNEIKIAIGNNKENFNLGNKVILHFSKNFSDNFFSIEHHYCLDGKQYMLEDEHPFRRPNKLSIFANGKRTQINSEVLLNDSKEVEVFIDKIIDYFNRVELLNKKRFSIAV